MVKEIGDKRGRPLLLSARVLATIAQNRAIGLDPVGWAKEGLVDFLIVSHYLRNDFPLKLKPFREAIPDTIPLYASIEVEPDVEIENEIVPNFCFGPGYFIDRNCPISENKSCRRL